MLNINFACVNSRKNKAGESPIQLWINCDGKRATTHLELRVKPSIFQKSMKSRQQNPVLLYCDAVRWRIINFYASSVYGGTTPTSKQIIEYVRNKYTVKQYMLYDLLDDFLRLEQTKRRSLVNSTTYRKYSLVVSRMKEVIENKPLKQVTHSDIMLFKYHLQQSVGLNANTLCGYIAKAKTIFSYALDQNLIDKNPCRNIRVRKQEVEIQTLTREELERIRLYNFELDRLDRARDCFIFAANTAIAYADLATICRDDIREQDGIHYIKKCRVKTGIEYIVPLNDVAMEILRRRNYRLPIVSNQKYNCYLKEIAELCGIEKRLTSHIARHTAATLMLNSGISLESVAKILGHTNTKMTAHYAKLTEQTILKTKIDF